MEKEHRLEREKNEQLYKKLDKELKESKKKGEQELQKMKNEMEKEKKRREQQIKHDSLEAKKKVCQDKIEQQEVVEMKISAEANKITQMIEQNNTNKIEGDKKIRDKGKLCRIM